jgi:hypothetical protein
VLRTLSPAAKERGKGIGRGAKFRLCFEKENLAPFPSFFAPLSLIWYTPGDVEFRLVRFTELAADRMGRCFDKKPCMKQQWEHEELSEHGMLMGCTSADKERRS